jgi:hypothetical protein
MQITFDLISDLHLETWTDDLNWQGQATSSMCIIAGDIARDRDLVVKKLEQIASCYHMTFYIDGNDEHKYFMDNLPNSYRDLVHRLKPIKNLHYLHDNVVIINGVAILATNGWFGFDFDPAIDSDWSAHCWKSNINGGVEPDPEIVSAMSRSDTLYLKKSVHQLQRHRDVKKILIMTHTVPRSDLVNHDISLVNNWRYNVIGNSLMQGVLDYDTENKIHTWCFGHYHGSVDRILDGVHYINNCRGREDTEFKQTVYYPKRITIEV